jgi:hypothetical protein
MGLMLNFVLVDPVRALFRAAVLKGVTAAARMAVIMLRHRTARLWESLSYRSISRSWAGSVRPLFYVSAGVL